MSNKEKKGSRSGRRLAGAVWTLRVTPELARAWRDSAIHPILRALAVEADYLRRRAWTWRAVSRRCELLEPCEDLVPSIYVDNLDQMLSHHPDLHRLVKAYDKGLEKLVSVLNRAQKEIQGDAEFRRRLMSTHDRYVAAHPGDTLMGSRSWLLPQAVEYVLNGMAEVGSSKSTPLGRFWQARGSELVAFARKRFAPILKQVDGAGDEMLTTVGRLEPALRTFCDRLCDEQGVSRTTPRTTAGGV